MNLKDTPEGTTHYYGDGCGEPEHNPSWINSYPLNTFQGKTKQELIQFIESLLEQQRKEIADKVAGMNEEDYFPLTQAILSAFEHRGFYDAGKYIDPTIWDFVKPEIVTLLSTPLEKK